jgi:hypothetical protein
MNRLWTGPVPRLLLEGGMLACLVMAFAAMLCWRRR